MMRHLSVNSGGGGNISVSLGDGSPEKEPTYFSRNDVEVGRPLGRRHLRPNDEGEDEEHAWGGAVLRNGGDFLLCRLRQQSKSLPLAALYGSQGSWREGGSEGLERSLVDGYSVWVQRASGLEEPPTPPPPPEGLRLRTTPAVGPDPHHHPAAGREESGGGGKEGAR